MLAKSNFDNFLSAINSAGIKEYCIRCEGGNRILYHNGTSSVIVPKDDHIVCIEVTKNYGSPNGVFNIIMVPYDNIDDIKTTDNTFADSLKIMEALGAKNADVEVFMKQAPTRMPIVPGTAGLKSITEKDKETGEEKPVLGVGSRGYVTE